ncbi:putative ATP-binding protein involved in virulence [Arcicella aurantiaca]|uniref:Putative ATP-binding protein involved in virulence n=1 Tax=Arcicella aurantiaca TaxID=591202 RepID=A0A316EET9_9BACT|nr:ATP-binding protein [Arcicella aurantiaca]PWK29203.1 putative ATP-binding protein involved in virulence [Arcicella aurantiaca]
MENFRIESLEINKIGAFEHIKMDFPKKTDPDKAEIHILTGENGTGKSTVLESLAQSFGTGANINFLPKKLWDDTGIADVHFSENLNSILDFDVLKQNNTLGINKLGQIKFQEKIFNYSERLNNPDDYTFNFVTIAYSGHRSFSDVKVSGIDENLENSMVNALSFQKSINPKTILQWLANTKSKEYIAKGKGDENKSLLFAQKILDIEKIISEIICAKNEENVRIELEEDKFQIQLKIRNHFLSFDQLPDGIKSVFGWVADLVIRLHRLKWENDTPIFERNFILFLDEIEVHLHPAWQRKILPVVQKLFKNAQIFISTHSPFVVGSVDGAWVHKLKKGDDGFAVLDGEPVLSEDAESYDTILEEIFGIKERFGDEIEIKLKEFSDITKEILKGNEHRLVRWNEIILFFENQERPDEIMSYITPQIRQINRIRNQVVA